ncbi:MAG: acyl-ACP--UDP-N-acetylglucosamine O-acyltransferase [Thermodesulfobacteriota bacterium]
MIHPTAIIDPGAELGKDVTVGPCAVVGPKVAIGDGCVIGSHAVIESHVRMGSGNRISPFASVGAPPQDLKFRGEDTWVEMGDNNIVREFATINRGTAHGGGVTRLGSGNMVMAYCHIAHDCRIGNRMIMANAATFAGHITVEDGANIGGLVAVHQFVRIGTLSIIGGMSGVGKDVPPYVMAAPGRQRKGEGLFGLNKIGLQRNRIPEESVAALKKAYTILFRSKQGLKEALAQVEAEVPPLPEVRHLVEFIRASERGVLR